MKNLVVSNLKLPIDSSLEDLNSRLLKEGVIADIDGIKILKKSLDARDKSNIKHIYQVALISDFKTKKHLSTNCTYKELKCYETPKSGHKEALYPHVIIGSGPAGLFAALNLAKCGYKPIVIERGEKVDDRTNRVNAFWRGEVLHSDSNACFGEGGAGTFSDGKLNTGIKDSEGRERYVLETFVRCGADPSIEYWYKPHIGSDDLQNVVKNLREEIISLGGRFIFNTRVDYIEEKSEALQLTLNNNDYIMASTVTLAIGHSARDTYEMLKHIGADMRQKDMAIGIRIEHPQNQIQQSQYGTLDRTYLPAADYKCAVNLENKRGVYTFCMCPGGYVVNSSTENDGICINGMSNHGRDGNNANSAIIVTVGNKDYKSEDVLAGVSYQRELERNAYKVGCGNIPVQLYKDFKNNTNSNCFGEYEPEIKGKYSFGKVNIVFSENISSSICEGIESFSKNIDRFNRDDAIISGVEGRSSSPVRIIRDEHFESNIKGLFPCGEGAGYAGGIMSAAIDGLKVSEEIIRRYKPC